MITWRERRSDHESTITNPLNATYDMLVMKDLISYITRVSCLKLVFPICLSVHVLIFSTNGSGSSSESRYMFLGDSCSEPIKCDFKFLDLKILEKYGREL